MSAAVLVDLGITARKELRFTGSSSDAGPYRVHVVEGTPISRDGTRVLLLGGGVVDLDQIDVVAVVRRRRSRRVAR